MAIDDLFRQGRAEQLKHRSLQSIGTLVEKEAIQATLLAKLGQEMREILRQALDALRPVRFHMKRNVDIVCTHDVHDQ